MKRLLKITMVLAISLIAFGTYAQDDTQAVGSVHKFKVNVDGADAHLASHIGNTYTWAVYQSDGTTPAVAADFSFTTADNGLNINTTNIQWLQAGTFYVQITEQNATGICTTLRRSEILVSAGALDLAVIASDAAGDAVGDVDPDELTDCNDMSGSIIANAAVDFGSTARYFTVTMKTDNQPWTSGAWGFDYTTLAGATVTTTTLGVTIGATDISIPTGVSVVTFKVDVANTPGVSPANDITLNLVAANAYIIAGTVTTPETANLGNNTPDSFIITASPATSVIAFD